MGRIHVLPPNLVNKIAAGEVIERPASVLKELVENSLDAGAARIDIAVESGGKQLIRVSDDGLGMDGEDLALAVRPHATSKLADESDLFALHTMGFRGEALPSIGSVSQMRIVARTADSDQAFAIEVDGGEIGPVAPAAGSRGSAVEVRNLFFNTPARRKFLKADSTEVGHLTEALARIALAHTDIHFRMTHNGKLVYDLPAAEQLTQRVADFFGAEMAANLMPVELPPLNDQSPAVRGLIAPPQHSRQTPKWQYIFLNGRYIRNRFIQHAVREAYRGLMEPSRQPVVFLFLLLPPELVDFNVHPTKIEVRFADSNRIHSAILRCLRDKLTRTDLTAAGHGPAGDIPGEEAPEEDEQARQERIRLAMAEFFKRVEPAQRRLAFEPESGPKRTVVPFEPIAPSERQDPSPLFDRTRSPSGSAQTGSPRETGRPRGMPGEPEPFRETTESGATAAQSQAQSPMPTGASGADQSPTPPKSGRVPAPSAAPASGLPVSRNLGDAEQAGSAPARPATDAELPEARFPVVQIHNTYLVCQTDDGLIIVDQHALHERIIYETLYRRLADPNRASLQGQRLLLPQRVTLGARQAALLLDQENILARMGIELTPFGRDEVAVCAFPALLERIDPGEFVRGLADKLADEPPAGPEAFVHEVLDMMACKAAVKAGDPLTAAEINALLGQRALVERSSNCPHGRPTTLKFSLAELEKQFKRR